MPEVDAGFHRNDRAVRSDDAIDFADGLFQRRNLLVCGGDALFQRCRVGSTLLGRAFRLLLRALEQAFEVALVFPDIRRNGFRPP